MKAVVVFMLSNALSLFSSSLALTLTSVWKCLSTRKLFSLATEFGKFAGKYYTWDNLLQNQKVDSCMAKPDNQSVQVLAMCKRKYSY